MRKSWFQHVKTTREKENRKRARKKNPCSHQEAMKLASVTWAKQRTKLAKKAKCEKSKVVDAQKAE